MTSKRSLTSVVVSVAVLMAGTQTWAAIPWAPNLATAQQAAAQRNQLVLVHFWAPACGPCVSLERNVLSQPYVGDSISAGFVPVKVDASRDYAIAQRFGVRSWPTDVVLTPQGQVVRILSCPQDPGKYAAQLRAVMEQVAMASGGPPAAGAWETGPPYGNSPPLGAEPSSAVASDRNANFAPQPRSPYNGNDYPSPAGPLREEPPAYQAQPGPPIAYDYRGGGPVTQPNDPRAPYVPQGGPMQDGQGYAGGSVGPAQPPMESGYGGRYTGQDVGRGGPAEMAAGEGSGFRSYAAPPPSGEWGNQNDVAGRSPGGAPDFGQDSTGETGDHPPIGLEGHCPVTLMTTNAWKKGDRNVGAIHRGRTYLFVGLEEQRLFLEQPDAYSPVLSGNDAVEFVDNGRLVPGTRRHGLEYNRQMYLFASEASLERFARSPRSYAISVFQAMQQASPGQTSQRELRSQISR